MKIYEILKEAHQVGLIQTEKINAEDIETEFPDGIPDNYFTSKSGNWYRADMTDLDMNDLTFKTYITRRLRLILGCAIFLVIIHVLPLIIILVNYLWYNFS